MTNPTAKGPNPLVRLVARVRASIRIKLLVAFLGITALMAGLALFGLATLEQPNARTKKLIWDQQRIAFFNDIYASLDELKAIALALSIERAFIEEESEAGWFGSLGWAASDRSSLVLRELKIGARRFGKTGMPDAEFIGSARDRMKTVLPIAQEINSARKSGDWPRAAHLGRTTFFESLRSIQRDAYTRVQLIEDNMAATARVTSHAFIESRRQVIGAALSAIGLALLLGYSISSALIWPVSRI